MRPPIAAAVFSLVVGAGCATTLQPTEQARILARNPPAVVEGRVTDEQGRPVAGVRVQAIPRGRDVIWSAPAPTDAAGNFRLSLDAPSDYAFLIFEGDVAVVTPSPRDPAQVRIFVKSGETRRGIELTMLRADREDLFAPGHQSPRAPAPSPPKGSPLHP